MLGMVGCSGINKKKQLVAKDSVSLAKIDLNDSTSYYLNGSDKCRIYASVVMSYPSFYKDKEKTEQLQKLFLQSVLDIPSDSTTLASAFPQFLDNQLNVYKNNNASIGDDNEVDYEPVYKYFSKLRINAPYNSNGLVCFCKEVVTEKNDRVTTTRHYYYMFNLEDMSRIELTNLFSEEQIGDIGEMLKDKLRKDLNVENDDQLNDLGYFNFDNLVANNNFYISNDGITWVYLPRELSVIDEVKITLSYESLKAFIPANSILSPFLKHNGENS